MDSIGAVSILGILSFIVGLAKEILIIVLIFKLIKISNVYLGKNMKVKDEEENLISEKGKTDVKSIEKEEIQDNSDIQ